MKKIKMDIANDGSLTYAKNWAEVYMFITTAKNYISHSFTPNGELFVNNVLMSQILKKKRGNLIFSNTSDKQFA
jgi:hypothetical protein